MDEGNGSEANKEDGNTEIVKDKQAIGKMMTSVAQSEQATETSEANTSAIIVPDGKYKARWESG